jgi:hypothetical protein
MVVVVGCLWATDAVLTGVLRINKDAIQWTLLAAALYGIVQIMPFGSLAETAGISAFHAHLADPFGRRSRPAFFRVFRFLAALLTYIDATKGLRRWLRLSRFSVSPTLFRILQAGSESRQNLRHLCRAVCDAVRLVRQPAHFARIWK